MTGMFGIRPAGTRPLRQQRGGRGHVTKDYLRPEQCVAATSVGEPARSLPKHEHTRTGTTAAVTDGDRQATDLGNGEMSAFVA